MGGSEHPETDGPWDSVQGWTKFHTALSKARIWLSIEDLAGSLDPDMTDAERMGASRFTANTLVHEMMVRTGFHRPDFSLTLSTIPACYLEHNCWRKP
jgi:hypothetical protein